MTETIVTNENELSSHQNGVYLTELALDDEEEDEEEEEDNGQVAMVTNRESNGMLTTVPVLIEPRSAGDSDSLVDEEDELTKKVKRFQLSLW